ncbi:MAG TPA: prolipoprotein diacylglyceryl transferase [Anaerolineae bacterium]|nr:prolipoprotein diacylglyceryl transferase [Anaerolineae bacterium]
MINDNKMNGGGGDEVVMGRRWRGVPWYWVPIVIFIVGGGIVFMRHLQTGLMPDRVALTIPLIGLDVYWYGVLIMFGLGMGCVVAADVAEERGRRIWVREVPAGVRQRPLATLSLPEEIAETLAKRKIETVGELLLRWGWRSPELGLNKMGMDKVGEVLVGAEGVEERWVAERPPWHQYNPEHVWNGVIWAAVLAVIGARIYHILTPSPSMAAVGIYSPLDYFKDPLKMINLRLGGLGLYGGLVGGALGLWIYGRRQGVRLLTLTDLSAIAMPLGQTMGRWGNFMNQELYGAPAEWPWAIAIDPRHRLVAYAESIRYHPTFLYESIWNFGVFLTTLYLARRYDDKLKLGDLTAIYLVLYGIGRILMETVRLDSRASGGVPIATWVSVVAVVVAGGALVWRRRRDKIMTRE